MKIDTHHLGTAKARTRLDALVILSPGLRPGDPGAHEADQGRGERDRPGERPAVLRRQGIRQILDRDVRATPGHLRHGEKDHRAERVGGDRVSPYGGRGQKVPDDDLVPERYADESDRESSSGESDRRHAVVQRTQSIHGVHPSAER